MRDLNELRRLAEAALAECGGLTWWLSGKLSVRAGSSRWVCKANWDGAAAAKHIVSFDPTVSLALLDRLERAEAEAARLRGLLAEAGKALEPFARVTDLNIPNQPWIRQVPVFDEVISTIWTSRYRSARTVATKIEEALK